MCFVVPIVGAVATSVAYKRTKSKKIGWLNLMFYGASLFGVIDHLWNGELFLISDKLGEDLFLGFAIAATIVVGWMGVCLMEKRGWFYDARKGVS